ncbi:MAG: type II toxin-antitoxin system VapC family toxin [Gallionella sp.]|nr:type II toxin-antitoxin system VapC family toxin [Gallionella sp.]
MYLLDTCVLSELVKANPESAVLAWMAERKEHELFVSAMTIAELYRGIAKLPTSPRKSDLTVWLQQVEAGFDERVMSFTLDTAHVWAQMCANAEAAGKSMAAFDSIIVATAVEHSLCLVTRNIRDFSNVSVELLNPWPAR